MNSEENKMTEEPVIEVIEPQAPVVTENDVMSVEEQKKILAELEGFARGGMYKATNDTAHLPRSQQDRSKYNASGILREVIV